MRLSLFWVAVVAVAAYYYGRNRALNGVVEQASILGRAEHLAAGLTPGKAIADALEPPSPAVGQTNPTGTSAWAP